MIERTSIGGRKATVAYLASKFKSVNPNDAEFVKIIFDDGQVVFARRDNPTVHDYDPDQPRAPAGDPDGGQWVGENNGKSSTGTAAQRLQKQSGVRRSSVELETQSRSDLTTPLEGLPRNVTIPGVGKITAGPLPEARQAAYDYMKSAGLPYDPPTEYVKVDAERATRIANEYDKMKHDPNDPKVKASYDAMIKESIAQLKAVQATGLDIDFIDMEKQSDPYAASPRLATEDVKNNNHLWVFPTSAGFGSSKEFDASDNPLLQKAGVTIHGHELVANDVFRIVHDYFGHIKEGNGFRADGEENAWRSHSAMFSPLARQAMTTETRGQNSWVNYGPYGEQNRTAKSDTHFADQKVGLLPEWVAKEGSGQHSK